MSDGVEGVRVSAETVAGVAETVAGVAETVAGVQAERIRAVLRGRRELLGLSQRELATRLGTRQAQVSLWERGRSSPSLLTHLRWAAGLGVSLSVVDEEGVTL